MGNNLKVSQGEESVKGQPTTGHRHGAHLCGGSQEKPQDTVSAPASVQVEACSTSTALFEGHLRIKKHKAQGGKPCKRAGPFREGMGWKGAFRGFQGPEKVFFLKPGVLNIGIHFSLFKSCLPMYFIQHFIEPKAIYHTLSLFYESKTMMQGVQTCPKSHSKLGAEPRIPPPAPPDLETPHPMLQTPPVQENSLCVSLHAICHSNTRCVDFPHRAILCTTHLVSGNLVQF